MIQDSKEGKLFNVFTHGITVACANPDSLMKFVKVDDPVTVKVAVSKEAFVVSDGHFFVPCLFTNDAIFWYRMEDPKKMIKELDGKFLVLKEYAPHSIMNADGEAEIFLLIHSFVLVDEESKIAKGKELVKEIEKHLDILKKAHLRKDMKLTELNKLPDLEGLLAGKDVAYKGVIPAVKKGKKKDEEKKEKKEKEVVVKFKELDKVEKEIAEKVAAILKEEKQAKKTTIAGSEGDYKRKDAIEKGAAHINDYFKNLLKERGLLYKKRTPNKASPAIKRSPPKDIKKAVEFMKEGVKEGVKEVVEKVTAKRPKAEGAEKKKEKPAKKAKKEGKKKA
jgi:hypothetical protein